MSAPNLSDPEIERAYKTVLSGDPSINWVLLSYSGSSDLKVQATGADGLDELQEEFSDGRHGHLPSNPTYPYLRNEITVGYSMLSSGLLIQT